MKSFIIGTVITAIAFWVLTNFLSQFVSYEGEVVGLLVLAVIFGVVNGLIGPLVKVLTHSNAASIPRFVRCSTGRENTRHRLVRRR